MLISLIVLIVVIVLIIAYLVLQVVPASRDKGDEKLINRKVPPYEPDATKAGAADYE